jgi:glycine/serine hydroxymethyltransferase
MGEEEMRQVARLIAAVLHEPESEEVRARVRESVHELSARFPLYPNRLRRRPEIEAMGAD